MLTESPIKCGENNEKTFGFQIDNQFTLSMSTSVNSEIEVTDISGNYN